MKEDSRVWKRERESGNRRGRPISPASRSTYRGTKRRLSAGTCSLSSPANISKLVARSGGESLPLKCINFQPMKGWVKGMVVRSRNEFSFPSRGSSLVTLRRDNFREEFCSQMDRHCFDPFLFRARRRKKLVLSIPPSIEIAYL